MQERVKQKTHPVWDALFLNNKELRLTSLFGQFLL